MATTPLPDKMTAIAITEPGGPLVLKPERRDVPEPGTGEILIRVRAAGVNRPDVFQRKGAYPPPRAHRTCRASKWPATVAALGAGATRWRIGDAGRALTPGGGYAEYAIVHESNALPIPHGFTFTEAAAIPETFFTVWHNVFERGGLKKGETFLVHGGTSGIGTTAIQLASAFGSYVFDHGRLGREMRRLPQARRRPRHQLPRGGFRPRS
jgi:NADPH:quinone reductase-like Zn-dependent oxidoreductase